jgi:hypothetical protein
MQYQAYQILIPVKKKISIDLVARLTQAIQVVENLKVHLVKTLLHSVSIEK